MVKFIARLNFAYASTEFSFQCCHIERTIKFNYRNKKIMEHTIRSGLLDHTIKVAVVGAGGTGSQIMTGLARLHHAMVQLGHPGGLSVILYDDDTVSESNVGRQAFYQGDIGSFKAPVVINRINLGFGLNWESEVEKVTAETDLSDVDLIVGCVDTRKARLAIYDAAIDGSETYWLDCGNMLDSGQVILGEIGELTNESNCRLPHIADLFPEMINPALDEKDEVPSCSLADALEKQSLFINSIVANMACNILFELFRFGKIRDHGCFINLKLNRINPIPISYEMWSRLGYEPFKQAA